MSEKLTLRDLKTMQRAGEPITAATAYDYASIHLVEEAEIDILVPSDWGIATTLFGQRTALQATLDHVVFYLKALGRLAQRGFVLAPMPFGSYEVSNEEAVANAALLMKAGADSVKLEGGGLVAERVRALSEMGIPCAGHLGYTPQQIRRLGGERAVGDVAGEAAALLRDAQALEEAGAWGVVLQHVPERVARIITDRTALITIGAGGTRGCDGHMVLTHDLVGWPQCERPLFSVQYAEFFERAVAALNRHCAEVQALEFPTEEHTFHIPEDEFEKFLDEIGEE